MKPHKQNIAENIDFLSESEITSLINRFSKNRVVFWVGAGIDIDPPTNLPSGYSLTKAIIEMGCGKYACEIIKYWEKVKAPDIFREGISTNKIPRLESIIESVREFESHLLKQYSVINGFKSFLDAPPNHNHYVLAKFLNEGANIITTNYDICIPKAYNASFHKEFKISYDAVKDESGVYNYISSNPHAGRIYHIHGTASNLTDIGASLGIVKNSLPTGFTKLLDQWIDDEYCFIFLGYSGLDTLDINRYFENRGQSLKSTGIYVRHCQSGRIKSASRRPNGNELILLRSFKKEYICGCNTGHLLKFWTSQEKRADDFEWRKRFEDNIEEYPEKLHIVLALGIAYGLGNNIMQRIDKDWLIKVQQYDELKEWYINYYIFCTGAIQGDIDTVDKFGSRLKQSSYNHAEINAAQNRLDEAVKHYHLPSELLVQTKEFINENKIISWGTCTPLNRYTNYIVQNIIKRPFSYKQHISMMTEQALAIIESYKLILKEGYDRVQHVNQINTASRGLAILEMIFNNNLTEAKKRIKFAYNNYAAESSANGISVVLFFASLIYSFDNLIQRSFSSTVTSLRLATHTVLFIVRNRQNKYRKYAFYAALFAIFSLIFSRSKLLIDSSNSKT